MSTIKSPSSKKKTRKYVPHPNLHLAKQRAIIRGINDEKKKELVRHKLVNLSFDFDERIKRYADQQRSKEGIQRNKLLAKYKFLSIAHPDRDYAGMKAVRLESRATNAALRKQRQESYRLRQEEALKKRQLKTEALKHTHILTGPEAAFFRKAGYKVRARQRVSNELFSQMSSLSSLDVPSFSATY